MWKLRWAAFGCALIISGLFFNFALAANFFNQYPKPIAFINDYGNLLFYSTEEFLENYVQEVAKNNGPQIVVVTVPDLAGEEIDTARHELFNVWGVGVKGKDNGVLLLIARAERQMGIEIGYGMEDKLTDLQAKWIIEEILKPKFINGEFDVGIINAVAEIRAAATGEKVIPNFIPNQEDTTVVIACRDSRWVCYAEAHPALVGSGLVGGIFLFIIILILLINKFSKGGDDIKPGSSWLIGLWNKRKTSSDLDSGSSGGRSSLGGGSSGGGGASGSW